MRVITDEQFDKTLLETFQANLVNQDLSAKTIRGYLHDIKMFKEWLDSVNQGKPVSLTEAATMDLAVFRTHLIEEKSLKPATVNRRIQSLRLFFRWLKEQKYIKNDPAENIHFMRISRHQRPHSLTRNEVLSFLRAATVSPHGMEKRNFAMAQLMLQTGLRLNEVATLKRKDLQIKARSGYVRVLGKGLKERKIPLNTTVRTAIKDYLDHIGTAPPQHPVFLSNRGKSISARTIQKIIANIVKRSGIKRIKVSNNTLRHTFAVNYLKSNPGKLVELATILGHESLNTTAIYTWPSGEDLAQDLERSPLNVLGK